MGVKCKKGHEDRWQRCSQCAGSGKKSVFRCGSCDGSGKTCSSCGSAPR